MTDETKKEVESARFAHYRTKAVSCLRSLGVPDVEDSWEGMMRAVDYVKSRGDRDGEFSGAMMAMAMWVHGYLEEDTMCALEKTGAMVDREVAAAAEKTEDGHAEAAGAQAATPSAVPSSVVKTGSLPRMQAGVRTGEGA